MQAHDRPEHSLLVKAQAGARQPFALEDLRTGRRRGFDTVAALLAALAHELTPAAPPSTVADDEEPP
jgi:hypothetical protein